MQKWSTLDVCAVKQEQRCVKKKEMGLVPLTKSGPTVGTPSLAQRKAKQDAQGKEEDGTQDTQTREVIFQDPHSAGRTASHHHHRGLNYGIGPGIGLLGHSGGTLGSRESLGRGVLVRRRDGSRDGPIALLWWWAILVYSRDSVIRGRSVLKQRFSVHHFSCPV